ncbi:MAG: PilZ domain-containing protein [Spirochaetales bacterium]|nr:PilZ domain-containing protein [Spirochaetales bacterium]
MGIPLSRIEKEFIFRSLKEQGITLFAEGGAWEIQCKLLRYTDFELECEILKGDISSLNKGDDVQIVFSFQNNNFTFLTALIEKRGEHIVFKHPDEVCKNANREYRRIKIHEKLSVYFFVKQKRYELNFPRIQKTVNDEVPEFAEDFDPASITQLIQVFQEKMRKSVSEHKIVMMKDRKPETYEEDLMVSFCKILWIPSTEKEIPALDPFLEDRIITKLDMIEFEERQKTPTFNMETKFKDLLFQKKIKGIHSEVYCPIFYSNYMVGYIHACNREDIKQEITNELIEYIDQFSKVLSYSLKVNGYFKEKVDIIETGYDAPIIDISASGLLFVYNSKELEKELDVFNELSIYFHLKEKKFSIESVVIRKFEENNRFYYGLKFRKTTPHEFSLLYEYLYSKPFTPQGKYVW